MIKAVLKRNNILLSEFADSINISRPTLDVYIRNYDSGGRLSNNLFQKIFDFLFSDVQMSKEDFQKRYVYVIENYGKTKIRRFDYVIKQTIKYRVAAYARTHF